MTVAVGVDVTNVGGLRASSIDALVEHALATAARRHLTMPGEAVAADLIRDLAAEALPCRNKLADLDKRIAEVLDRHPDTALVQSLPGIGVHLDRRRWPGPRTGQSGKVHYLRRATSGDKTLKRIFYQSAFCTLQRDPTSRAFYDRKRAQGKRQHQALIALADRRINVLHAILRTRQPHRVDHALAA